MRVGVSTMVGLLLVGGCGLMRNDPAERPAPPSGSFVGQLVGTNVGPSQITGRVVLIPRREGQVRAEIELRNIRHPARHPWVILRGNCGESNAVEISSRAVPEVESRPDGTGFLAAQVDATLRPAQAYNLVLLENRSSNVVVACASLSAVY